MIESNIDSLLSFSAKVSWFLLTLYALLIFVNTLWDHGPISALIRLFSFRVLVPFLFVVGLSLLSLAIVFIQPQEVGVVVSVLSAGGVRPQPLRAGFHWIVPLLESDVRYPIYWQTYTMSGSPREGNELGDDSIRARTSDGQEVRLDCSVIFRIDLEQAVSVHIDWQDRYIHDFVRPVMRGFVRTHVSQFTVSEVNSSKRKDLEAALDRELRTEFANKGLDLDQFLLRDITFTPEYAASIEEKQVALEGKQQTEYEAQQYRNLAEGRADAIEIEARAKANALKAIAEALDKNPDLVTYEYVQKLAPNVQVMLVPNTAPFILPLPSLTPTGPLTATQAFTSTLMTTPGPHFRP
ncbi:MAG: prohibitin family protein [Caldilineaceae bacterium]